MKSRSDIFLKVANGVYDPREDSYLLLDRAEVLPGERVLEVGTGSGLIALHAAAEGARVTATDIDASAARCARENAVRNGLEIDIVVADVLEGVRGPFDLVMFNPPYLPAEPGLPPDLRDTGGEMGDEVSLRFVKSLARVLAPAGRAYLVASSLQPAGRLAAAAEGEFGVEVAGATKLFFEEVSVLTLVPRRGAKRD